MKLNKDYTYEDIPEFDEYVDGAVHLRISGETMSTTMKLDVPYCKIGDCELHLEIIIPYSRNSKVLNYLNKELHLDHDKKPKFPCIVWVQGSAWMEQGELLYAYLGEYAKLAEKGYVIAVAEYRHSGIAAFPAQVIDIRNAIRFMKKNADNFFVDPDKMLLGGNSSGGHVAMCSGIYHNDENNEENLFPGISAEVKGIINQFGSTDFTFEDSNPQTENRNRADSPQGMVMGGKDLIEHPELAEQLTVKCNITPATKIVPSLHLHGTKDRLVNTKCSVYLYQKLRECGKEATLVILDGEDHGGPAFFAEPALALQDGFLQNCLMNKSDI